MLTASDTTIALVWCYCDTKRGHFYYYEDLQKKRDTIDAFRNVSLPLEGGSGHVWADGNSCFELKAGQTIKIEDIAKFLGQAEMEAGVDTIYVRELIPVSEAALYGSVTVNNSPITREGPVTIDGINYYYYQQAINLMADERVLYSNYTNTISAANMGYLAVRKMVESGQNYAANTTFPFAVKVNGSPVPDGTMFLVRDSSGNYVEEIASQNGVISIKDGQTAYMKSRLLAGVKYTVTEQVPDNWVCDRCTTAQGQGQYPANFNAEQSCDPASGGTIVANETSRVTAYNKRAQFGVDIPVEKKFVGAKDVEVRTATFMLEEENPTGTMTPQTITITCTGTAVSTGNFHIDYDGSVKDGDYRYKITETETAGGQESEVIYQDPSEYIVTVRVQNKTATIEAVTKDGAALPNNDKTVRYVNLVNAVELPATGGEGTSLYTFSGMALICAAALVYSKQRRKRKGVR